MSAEPKRVPKPEVWTRWEGHLVKGIFPLRSFLGGSERGAVFLSEYKASKTLDAAIKLMPALPSRADAQLAHWRTAAALSHPHLVRHFDMGRCQLEGREFLFLVMEYGEQTLAQFLAQRALTAGEVRALLLPTLDALAFLHSNQLVHAGLKPSNLLIVGDQLKLTCDAVRPLGHAGAAIAGDIFSLGETLVEAFTQRTPDEQSDSSSWLADVPGPFANMVRRCLNPNAASRPTVAELQAQYKTAPEGEQTSEDRAHAHPVLLAIPVTLLVLLAVLINPQPSDDSQADAQPAAVLSPIPTAIPAPARASAPAPAPAAPSAKPAQPKAKPVSTVVDTSSPVLLEVKPDVPRALRTKIQGRILVTVRVLVDPSGDVMAAMVEKAGPNRNLANLADESARKWKFVPAEEQANRVWILTFAFTQEGVTARATGV